MNELKENWQQENIEKTKKVLTEHFKRKKEEEMFKEMLIEALLFSTPIRHHYSENWDLDSTGFDKTKDDFIDGFIQEDLITDSNKKEKQ